MKISCALIAAMTLVSTSAIAHGVGVETQGKAAQSTAEKTKGKEPTSNAKSHGGGLDKFGCHTNHKTGDYHCHR